MADSASDAPQPRIADLPDLVAALPRAKRAAANRLYQIVGETGVIAPPDEMLPWLGHTFGSVEATLRQRVVRVSNRWTFEGATFNPLRALRPGAGTMPPDVDAELHHLIEASRGDDFCDPERRTPADPFGRVRGTHVLTAGNVAKADGWHGVGIFREHDPLAIDDALVADMLAVAGEWAERAHAEDAGACHLFLLWNCLPRAGASLMHGHVQMTLGREMPHGHVALWRAAAERYRRETDHDYFADLLTTYRALSLSVAHAATATFATLTPAKEREVDIVVPLPSGQTTTQALGLLAAPLARLLDVARHSWGVRAFNLAIFGPPLGEHAGWEGFPLVARFVDRGNPLSTTGDVAAMELFGSSVIATDPFAVARSLRDALPR